MSVGHVTHKAYEESVKMRLDRIERHLGLSGAQPQPTPTAPELSIEQRIENTELRLDVIDDTFKFLATGHKSDAMDLHPTDPELVEVVEKFVFWTGSYNHEDLGKAWKEYLNWLNMLRDSLARHKRIAEKRERLIDYYRGVYSCHGKQCACRGCELMNDYDEECAR